MVNFFPLIKNFFCLLYNFNPKKCLLLFGISPVPVPKELPQELVNKNIIELVMNAPDFNSEKFLEYLNNQELIYYIAAHKSNICTCENHKNIKGNLVHKLISSDLNLLKTFITKYPELFLKLAWKGEVFLPIQNTKFRTCITKYYQPKYFDEYQTVIQFLKVPVCKKLLLKPKAFKLFKNEEEFNAALKSCIPTYDEGIRYIDGKGNKYIMKAKNNTTIFKTSPETKICHLLHVATMLQANENYPEYVRAMAKIITKTGFPIEIMMLIDEYAEIPTKAFVTFAIDPQAPHKKKRKAIIIKNTKNTPLEFINRPLPDPAKIKFYAKEAEKITCAKLQIQSLKYLPFT